MTQRTLQQLLQSCASTDGDDIRIQRTPGQQRPGYVLIAFLLSLLLVELLRTAWIGDDAAITLRTVINLLAGDGPNFNIGERVQAYTHPLWFGLLAACSALIGDVYSATFALSIITSLAVMYVLLRYIAVSVATALLVLAVAMLSRAWVDYSSSGLENPLSHLLCLAIFLSGLRALAAPGKSALFFLCCGLLYLNRPDLLVLVAPFAALLCWSSRGQPRLLVKAIAIGALPVLLWSLFALFYYGFPFPNTAYAKLGTGIPRDELFYQGTRYLVDSFSRDPITLVFIMFGLLSGVRTGRVEQMLVAGILLYLLWVVGIGGDFMSGRYLTAPLLLALIILARTTMPRNRVALLGAVALVLGATNMDATVWSGASFSQRDRTHSGIADERGYYYQNRSLLSGHFPQPTQAERVVSVACGGLGYHALELGRKNHVIDACGLSDPLLARLPARYDAHWRVGHYHRQLPTAYIESVEQQTNLLSDAATHNYYTSLRLVTQGSLLDPLRLREILRLNLDRVPKPDAHMYRYELLPAWIGTIVTNDIAPGEKLSDLRPTGGGILMTTFFQHIDVRLPHPQALQSISLLVWLNGRASYQLSYISDGQYHVFGEIDGHAKPEIGAYRYSNKLKMPTPPVDHIRITAVGSDGPHKIGNVRIIGTH